MWALGIHIDTRKASNLLVSNSKFENFFFNNVDIHAVKMKISNDAIFTSTTYLLVFTWTNAIEVLVSAN